MILRESGALSRRPRSRGSRVLRRLVTGLFALATAGSTLLAAAGPTVEGRVLDAAGRPAAGVAVTLEAFETVRATAARTLELDGSQGAGLLRPSLMLATTGADGRYRLAAPEIGFYWLAVRAPHTMPQQLALMPLIEDRVVSELRLEADAGMTVRVLDPGGRPVPRALVSLSAIPRLGSPILDWVDVERRARTAADGTARLARRAGEIVKASAAVDSGATANAAPLAAAESAEVRDATATITLAAAARRRILLCGPRGEPVGGALVLDGNSGLPLGRTADDGTLSVAAPLGAQPLLALAENLAPLTLSGEAAAGTPTPPGARDATAPSPRVPRCSETRPDLAVHTFAARTRLEGRVVDAGTRAPVAGALVWLDASEPARADGQGRYQLFADERGMLLAAAPGYVLRGDFSHGAADQGGTLLLERAGALVGRVLDEHRRPLADAVLNLEPDVSARPSVNMLRRFSIEGAVSTRSDAAGRFRFGGLDAAGSYVLAARHVGRAPARLEVALLGEPASPTGSASPSREVTVILALGERVELRVADPAGKPVSGATATLGASVENGLRQGFFNPWRQEDAGALAQTDAGGVARWEHRATGRYDVAVTAPGYAPLRLPGVTVATPSKPGRAVDLGSVRLSPAAVLEGLVVDLEERPLADVTVTLSQSDAWLRRDGQAPEARSGVDGSFRIGDLTPGARVDLRASRQGLGTAMLNGVDVPAARPVRLVMAPLARVRGRTLGGDGKPVAGAEVRAQAVLEMGMGRGTWGADARAKSNELGEFVLSDVPAGRIEVSARRDGMVPAMLNGLEVPPGHDLEGLELVLRPGGLVQGTVYGGEGEPLPGASVREGDVYHSGHFVIIDTSDGDGHYRLADVEPGPRTFSAYSEEQGTATATLEVKPGENVLDLRFKGGVSVSGSVVDEQGAGVPAAQITLYAVRRTSGGVSMRGARTDGEGRFTLAGVREGEYRVLAEAPNHATASLDALVVGAEPISDLELRVRTGNAIVGALRGLGLAELGRLSLSASRVGSPMSFREGAVDPAGRYRIPNLEPGEWSVTAWVQGGRHAGGRVVMPEGTGDATLDLEFRDGLVLSGVVRRGGTALVGAEVAATCAAENADGYGQTGSDGRFRIEGLVAGRYEIDVYTQRGGAERELEISADSELEISIPVGAIRGQVLDAADGSALAGVTVALQPRTQEHWSSELETATDTRGAYRVADVAAGEWTAIGSLSGYATARVPVTVPEEGGEVEADLKLERTDGLRLDFATAGGSVGDVMLTVLDAAGAAVAAGPFAVDANGGVRLATVAAGSYEILASANGTAVTVVRATLPGPPVPVRLVPGARLAVAVPELAADEGRAVVRVLDAGGVPFRAPSSAGVRSEWRIRHGKADVDGLLPGVWTVEVEAPDGRRWNATVTAPAGAATAVVPTAR